MNSSRSSKSAQSARFASSYDYGSVGGEPHESTRLLAESVRIADETEEIGDFSASQ